MSKKLTIQDIAGFCPEEAIWKMIADVSTFLIKDDTACYLAPNSIVVDGNSFIVERSETTTSEYLAPEQLSHRQPNEKQKVWSLGAVVYYMSTGHTLFGGHGSIYQKEHPSVLLPVLPKGLQALTSILQKCLCYSPEERISLQELHELSQRGLVTCERQHRMSMQTKTEQRKEVKDISEKWPEEMIEI